MEIEMTGWAMAKIKARTLGDLRSLIEWCDRYRVPSTSPLDWGNGYLYVDIHGRTEAVPATWIECGDHLVDDVHFDILVETHQHPELDEPKKPAKYDWPAIDRYGDPARPE